jgi:hypothetical protein
MTREKQHTPIDWEELLSSASRLQKIFPAAVLVGGTAAALHVHHRASFDADHVVADLRERFEAVLGELESVAGWETARVKSPVLILGKLDGIDTGIRQLIRKEPLETEKMRTASGETITVPTMEEILRIKGALILRRNATRDYLDFSALSDGMGDERVCQAMRRFDELYPQNNGESALMQLQTQLAAPAPYDLDGIDLSSYRDLQGKWHNWETVKDVCIHTSMILSAELERGLADEMAEARPAVPSGQSEELIAHPEEERKILIAEAKRKLAGNGAFPIITDAMEGHTYSGEILEMGSAYAVQKIDEGRGIVHNLQYLKDFAQVLNKSDIPCLEITYDRDMNGSVGAKETDGRDKRATMNR